MEYFRNKKIVITGHSGFKGSWLTLWLSYLGAEVHGISNSVVSNPNLYEVALIKNYCHSHNIDVTDFLKFESIINKIEPDFIFHFAAQSLVHESYKKPLDTFKTNSLGSINLLEILRNYKKSVSVILITSDKVYENNEWLWGYRENDSLGGKDPYSASKSIVEIAFNSYFESFFKHQDNPINIATARAGNVIGGGDWAVNRIVPDVVRAASQRESVKLRNPYSTRPWQHVLEPLSGYIALAKKINHNKELNGESFNFGPPLENNFSVNDLVKTMSKTWPEIKYSHLNDNINLYEAGLLKLNCEKAKDCLNWNSVLTFDETVEFTTSWYKNFYTTKNSKMNSFSIEQIEKYTSIAKDRGLEWANEKK